MTINDLNQQVAHLQEENEKLQALTTSASYKSCHDGDQGVHLSVKHQLQGHSDQSALLQKQVKTLESELQVIKLTLEDERRQYKEKLLELEEQLSISLSQVKQYD